MEGSSEDASDQLSVAYGVCTTKHLPMPVSTTELCSMRTDSVLRPRAGAVDELEGHGKRGRKSMDHIRTTLRTPSLVGALHVSNEQQAWSMDLGCRAVLLAHASQ